MRYAAHGDDPFAALPATAPRSRRPSARQTAEDCLVDLQRIHERDDERSRGNPLMQPRGDGDVAVDVVRSSVQENDDLAITRAGFGIADAQGAASICLTMPNDDQASAGGRCPSGADGRRGTAEDPTARDVNPIRAHRFAQLVKTTSRSFMSVWVGFGRVPAH